MEHKHTGSTVNTRHGGELWQGRGVEKPADTGTGTTRGRESSGEGGQGADEARLSTYPTRYFITSKGIRCSRVGFPVSFGWVFNACQDPSLGYPVVAWMWFCPSCFFWGGLGLGQLGIPLGQSGRIRLPPGTVLFEEV